MGMLIAMTSLFSLLTERWLPVRRASGLRLMIAPSDLTEGLDDDPIVAFDWPRPDFDAAAREFLIGLLSTACWSQVIDPELWLTWWEEPPTSAELAERLARLAPAFMLDGPGPCFLQDWEPLADKEQKTITSLLIDEPGDQTLKKNADLFVKRGRGATFSRSTAAMALFTLQAFAPAGGAGNRTSLRGGGPMTTLGLPTPSNDKHPVPLWNILWLNVWGEIDWVDPATVLPRVFPWLVPTRVSSKDEITTPRDVHPAQAYWGMPRRIRLVFSANPNNTPCDLTGTIDSVRVDAYRTQNYGTNYAAWDRAHPLTPYYRTKPTGQEWLPLHPQPGRLGYRDWVGLVVADAEDQAMCRTPAQIVGIIKDRLEILNAHYMRLLACGFDMDNMKARGFVESEMPIPIVDRDWRPSFDVHSRRMVAGAREVSGLLSVAVGKALTSGELPDAEKGSRRAAKDHFWESTEASFYEQIAALPEYLKTKGADTTALRQDWFLHLRKIALLVFDALVPMDTLEALALERLVKARRDLVSTLNGFGKNGLALYNALGLPPPESGKPKGKENKKGKASS